MKQDNQNQQNDLLKVVENIQEFLESYQGVNELYKRACKAMSILMFLQRKCQPDELNEVADMMQDYMMLLDALEPIREKGGQA